MKKKTLLFLFLSIFTAACFGQEKKSLDSSYVNYFKLSREIPYLHLNKTSFMNGEEVWFQAYILDQKTNKLHNHTTNLYSAIYNEKGEHKQSQLLFVKNGIASGSIKIDSTFTDGTYYLKASTNWMQNFKEDQSFIQKIHVIGGKKSEENIVESNSNYELQLLPEGGHLVEATNAVVGIIIKDKKNKGIQIKSGVLLDDKNNVVKEVSTNQFGLGKVSFYYKPNTNYKVKITTQNNETIIKNIEAAKKVGITLNVNNPNSTFIKLTMQTNKETLKNTANNTYHIYIHNTSSIIKSSFSLKENTYSYNSFLSIKKLQKGANIITILNDKMQPILERVFFNNHKDLYSDISSKVIAKSRDSLTITLTKNDAKNHFLSATFLPESTKSYALENTMYSKFLLKPYIKGDVENSSYYFKNTNRKKLADLDLLLLTQGWSKYNWYNIFNATPRQNFDFEKGITVKGTVNMNNLNDNATIVLFSSESELLLSAPVTNNKFSFDNIYLLDSSNVSFSIQEKNKLIKPQIYANYLPKLNTNPIAVNKQTFKSDELNLNLKDFIKERILLDEVVVRGKSKLKHKPKRSNSYQTFKVSDGLIPKRINILDFLRNRGFDINADNSQSAAISTNRGTSRGPISILGGGDNNLIKTPGITADFVKVFLDNTQIVSQYENSIYMINHLNVEDFDEIYYTKSFGGEIYLFTNPVRKYGNKITFLNNELPTGFSKSKEYYQPKYYSTSSDIFKNYGGIYWKSKIELDKENYTFKVPHLNQKSIRFYIEGIANDGSIIFEEKIITIK
ncbi:hypothetical protein [Polaribacter uvawellassae]|uniref:hypothetical protein n=1 Tax=Polaribacter uvawellassae TaxID=3133495 RepID=UPI00321B5552